MLSKPNLLCIVPPYATDCPPAGAAALLGHLRAHGCDDFDFIDLRLWAPPGYAPTYRNLGAAAENFVIDVPDLPLVLELLRAYDEGRPLIATSSPAFERYCRLRAIPVDELAGYLHGIDRFLGLAAARLDHVRFIGLTVWTSNYLTSLLFAAHLKRRRGDRFVLAGGPQVSESQTSARLGLRAGLFDGVAIGEGEGILLDAYTRFDAGRALHDIDGLQIDAERPPLVRRQVSLAGNAEPEYGAMPIEAYQLPNQPGRSGRGRALPFQLSRGCTDRCSFCSEWVFWRHYRSTPGDRSVAQVEALVARYGVTRLRMMDSLLNGHPGRLRRFAEGLLEAGLELSWSGFMRAQIEPELAALVRRAGLDFVFLGVESLDDHVLESMNKRRTQHDNLVAIETFLAAGVDVCAGLIAGFPEDNSARFAATVRALRAMQDRHGPRLSLNFEPFMLSPGQPLYSKLDELGLRTEPWDPRDLELGPRYRDITEHSPCTVHGPNQGWDRYEQLRTAELIGRSASVFHTFRWQTETLDPLSWRIHRIEGSPWRLFRTKSAAGACYALLLDADEATLVLDRTRNLDIDSDPRALIDRPELHAELVEIERRHLVRPSRVPAIQPLCWAGEVEPDEPLLLAPWVLVRRARASLLAVSAVAIRACSIPMQLDPIIRALARAPINADAAVALARAHGLELEHSHWLALARQLGERGMLVKGSMMRITSPNAPAQTSSRARAMSLPLLANPAHS